MKDIPGFEKTMGDRYAIEHFGERMQAMEFTTFRYHRWFKLVKDEMLLSFGLIDSRTVWNAYALYGDSANTDALFSALLCKRRGQHSGSGCTSYL